MTCLPIRGTASLVMGISSDTMFMKTVRDSKTVTPGNTFGQSSGLSTIERSNGESLM